MEKVLIEVYVPVLSTSWDMFIPQQIQMSDALEMIKKAVSDLSDRRFIANSNTAICHREDGTILNINLSVYELGLKNGSKLMLI